TARSTVATHSHAQLSKVPRRLLDGSSAIHVVQRGEIFLWLKHPANLRDLIWKREATSMTSQMGQCFWVTRLANRFLWPDAAKSFSASAQRAPITAARWPKVCWSIARCTVRGIM